MLKSTICTKCEVTYFYKTDNIKHENEKYYCPKCMNILNINRRIPYHLRNKNKKKMIMKFRIMICFLIVMNL